MPIDKDALDALAHVLYGRDSKPPEYLGGSEARIFQDAAERIAQLTQEVQYRSGEQHRLSERIVHLVQDKENMLMFMRSVKACPGCNKCAREAADWIDELTQEGQGDASPAPAGEPGEETCRYCDDSIADHTSDGLCPKRGN